MCAVIKNATTVKILRVLFTENLVY